MAMPPQWCCHWFRMRHNVPGAGHDLASFRMFFFITGTLGPTFNFADTVNGNAKHVSAALRLLWNSNTSFLNGWNYWHTGGVSANASQSSLLQPVGLFNTMPAANVMRVLIRTSDVTGQVKGRLNFSWLNYFRITDGRWSPLIQTEVQGVLQVVKLGLTFNGLTFAWAVRSVKQDALFDVSSFEINTMPGWVARRSRTVDGLNPVGPLGVGP